MVKSISPKLDCGKAIRYKINNHIVYNLISKEKVWQKAKGKYEEKYYNHLKSALFDMKKQMAKNNEKFLAMPRIASGLDGEDWEYIRDVIQDVFKDTKVSIQIQFIDEPVKIGGAKYLIEPSKSSQSRCKDCGKKIQKGFLRLKESIPVKNFIKDVYYCNLCAEKALIKIKSKAEVLLKELKKKFKQHHNICFKNKGIDSIGIIGNNLSITIFCEKFMFL